MLEALSGYVIVKEKESDLAIALAEEAKGQTTKGEVISVGPAWHNSSIWLESPVTTGMTVGYKKYQAQEYEYEGTKYMIVHFNDLMVVEKEKDV